VAIGVEEGRSVEAIASGPSDLEAVSISSALNVAYRAGLRISEVANLKVSDIDSQRMTLRVEQGKGQRDRCMMLLPLL
jgi:integrase/recombinase XerD